MNLIILTPKLDERSSVPLYMQIYDYVRAEISDGRIPRQSRLPSIRKLAHYLGISRTPVELAYQQLLAEGYVESKPRSGIFVAALDEPFHATGERPIKFVSEKSVITDSPKNAIAFDFGYGGIDLEHFPFRKWRQLLNQCFLPENRRLFLYGDLQGELELRVEIARYLHQVRGVRCDPDQIIIGAGTYHSLDLLCQLLKSDVSSIAIEEAVNEGVKAIFQQHRYALKPISLEPDGLSVEELAEIRAQAVYVTPSHQFPYGMILPIGKRYKLLNWAEEKQAYIIENDYDGEFRYYGKPIPALQGLKHDGKVVYVGTFSKALTPSFRLSYLVLPLSLLDRYHKEQHSYDQLASPIHQKTLQLFMQSGDFEKHMRKMRKLYQKKHEALMLALKTKLGEQAEIIGDGSGLHILLRVKGTQGEAELIERAERAGVKVYPTSIYRLNPAKATPSTILLGFGGLSVAQIEEGVALLALAWFGR